MTCFDRLQQKKYRLSKKNMEAQFLVCKAAFEHNTRPLEQCPLDKPDQRGDVWP